MARKLLSSGTLAAGEEVALKSEAEGRIVSLPLLEGARVKKGTLLVKINDAELKAQARQAEHQLKLAEAREFRQRTLLERQMVSREEYEIALQEKENLLAETDLLRAKLKTTEIRAPFDGVVGLKEVAEGSYVTPGMRIAGMYSLHPLKIDFSVSEQYFAHIRPGDSISIAVEGAAEPVAGSVYAIEPKVDPSTRMLLIRGYCPNEKHLLPPGGSARVEIYLPPLPEAIMIPSMAVLPDIRGQSVMLYKGGKAQAAPITLGYRSEDRVQVEGVAPGDTLIVSGLIQIQSGSAVRLSGERKPAT